MSDTRVASLSRFADASGDSRARCASARRCCRPFSSQPIVSTGATMRVRCLARSAYTSSQCKGAGCASCASRFTFHAFLLTFRGEIENGDEAARFLGDKDTDLLARRCCCCCFGLDSFSSSALIFRDVLRDVLARAFLRFVVESSPNTSLS